MKNNFEELVKRDTYQVFLFRCKAHFPFNFSDHLWFVVNRKGEILRYEVLHKKNCDSNMSCSYLHKNYHTPFEGINVFNFLKKFSWQSQLLHVIEGEDGSLAHEMVDFIMKSRENYPYGSNYSLFGPNCVTYVQWVLNNFPGFKFKLRNYIGKDFGVYKNRFSNKSY